jgi:hypothetical protein
VNGNCPAGVALEPPGTQISGFAYFVQSNDFTFSGNIEGDPVSGVISGNTITMFGEFQDGAETSTITVNLITTNCFSMSGTAGATISDGFNTCSNTFTAIFTRVGPCPPPLNDIDNDGIPNECDIDQTGGFDCDFDGQDDNCQIDSDGDGSIDPCDFDLDFDLTGEWIGTGTISSATVGNCPVFDSFTLGHEYLNQIYLSQTLNELSGILGSSYELSGTIIGDTVSLVIPWRSQPIDEYTMTEYVTLTILSCDYLVGTSLIEVTDGTESCTVTSSWELVKMDPCDSSGSGADSNGNPIFCNTNDRGILDGACTNSQPIIVSGMPSNFNVVTIEIGGRHEQFSDLVFELYIPGSGFVTLTDNLVGDSGFLLTFTEAGGLDPNGTWDLRVCDDANNGDQGTIFNWCLTFE